MASINLHLTTLRDKNIEREYDELRGKIVYGWTIKTKQPAYTPRKGLLKKPPIYIEAGSRWKEVLLERFEQRSVHGSDDTTLNYFDGTFHHRKV